jgi:elongation factor Ts
LSKVPLSADQLANILLAESRPVKDETALGIGELGENIQNRRAICFKAVAPVQLAGLTHPIPEGGVKKDVVQSGRYGVIVAYKPTAGGKSSPKNSARLEDIGRQLCQHIIGMNPTEIGTMKTARGSPDPVEEEPKAAEQASTEAESEQAATPYYDADETTLLNQEFLMDPDMTVGEYLIENEVEVLDFTRFECGEKIEPSQHG